MEKEARSAPGPTVATLFDSGGALVSCSFMFVPRVGVTAGLTDEGGVASNPHIYLAR